MTNLLNILATPTEVFIELKQRPKWVAAFALISLISLTCAWFLKPALDQLAYAELTGKLAEKQIERVLTNAEPAWYVSLLLTPVRHLVRWFVAATIIWSSCVLLGAEELKFKTIYSVVVHSELILVLMGVVSVLLVYLKGITSIHDITDLQPILGLDYLMRDGLGSPAVIRLLHSINVFSIWYIATLTIGISVMTKFGKFKSGMLNTGIWLLGVGFQIAWGEMVSSPALGFKR